MTVHSRCDTYIILVRPSEGYMAQNNQSGQNNSGCISKTTEVCLNGEETIKHPGDQIQATEDSSLSRNPIQSKPGENRTEPATQTRERSGHAAGQKQRFVTNSQISGSSSVTLTCILWPSLNNTAKFIAPQKLVRLFLTVFLWSFEMKKLKTRTKMVLVPRQTSPVTRGTQQRRPPATHRSAACKQKEDQPEAKRFQKNFKNCSGTLKRFRNLFHNMNSN